MTTPNILAYNRTGDIGSTSNGGSLYPDWVNNVVYIGFGGQGTAGGFAKFHGYVADTELLEKNCTDIGVPGFENALSSQATSGMSYNGYIVFTQQPANWPAYYVIKADDLTFNTKWGTDRSFGSPGSTQIGSPHNFAPLRFGTVGAYSDFMVITASRTVNALPVPSPLFNGNNYLGQVDEHLAECGPGAIGTTGTAFVVGWPAFASNPSGASGLYQISANSGSISMSKVGTFAPSDIDATWSTWSEGVGIGYDQTDGNVLVMVATTDSVTHKAYLAKLDATSAAVLWATPIAFIDLDGSFSLPRANITAQTFYSMQANTLYTFDTSTGAVTTATIGLLTYDGPQVSDDVSQSLMLRGTWSETTTHPNYLGSYMGPPGNHTTLSTKRWIRFWPGDVPPPPPVTFTLGRATAGGVTGSFITSSPQPPPLPQYIPVIPSYLYQEYNDDDNLQAFVAAYNTIAQAFSDWFTSLHLPIYTSDPISGSLLDWVAKGIYGMARPALGIGSFSGLLGPLNTYQCNVLAPNQMKRLGNAQSVAVTDDIFRRILTWHIEKRYGKVFNIKWLKYRVVQFLNGANGIPLDIDNTYQVSVTFGANRIVNINFPKVKVTGVTGFMLNTTQANQRYGNEIHVTSIPLPPTTNAALLRAAIESGALELPFQYTYVVNG